MTQDQLKEYQRKYREDNHDEYIEYQREYRMKNRCELNRSRKMKYRNDPEYRYSELERKRNERSKKHEIRQQ